MAALVVGTFVSFEFFLGSDLPEDESDKPEVYTGNFDEPLPEDINTEIPLDEIDHTEISIADLGRSYLYQTAEGKFHDDCRANNVRTTITNHRSSNVIVILEFQLERIGAPDINGTGEVQINGNDARTIRFIGPELLGREFCIERDNTTVPHLVHADLKVHNVISTEMSYGEWDAENMVDYDGEVKNSFSDRADLTYNIPLTYLEVGDEVYVDLRK